MGLNFIGPFICSKYLYCFHSAVGIRRCGGLAACIDLHNFIQGTWATSDFNIPWGDQGPGTELARTLRENLSSWQVKSYMCIFKYTEVGSPTLHLQGSASYSFFPSPLPNKVCIFSLGFQVREGNQRANRHDSSGITVSATCWSWWGWYWFS